jgi:glycosyltransferase involved in cell wall biosynthesis
MTTTTVGYCVPEFPSQTHAFFWREALAMRDDGVTPLLLSTRRPPHDACPHAFAATARAQTHYVAPPRLLAATAFLARRPMRTLRAAAYVMGLRETSLAGRLRLLATLPCAADMVIACRRAGVRHVHIHSCADAAHLGAVAFILDDLGYSLTLHGDLPVYGRDHAAKMTHAAFVTAVTAPLRDQIEAAAPGRDALVISMGVDADRFAPSAPRKSDDGSLHAVSIARLNYVKGHVYFLEAMARLVGEGLDIRYTIAGDGPHRAEVVAAITRLGLDDRVTMAGSISEDTVVSLLQSADVFALTSFGKGEAAPVAVMEAMACGAPVICSRIGGTADMIVDGEDGFLTPQQDVDAIATALERLARDPALRARIGAAARAAALARFDYRAKARALCDALRAAGA